VIRVEAGLLHRDREAYLSAEPARVSVAVLATGRLPARGPYHKREAKMPCPEDGDDQVEHATPALRPWFPAGLFLRDGAAGDAGIDVAVLQEETVPSMLDQDARCWKPLSTASASAQAETPSPSRRGVAGLRKQSAQRHVHAA